MERGLERIILADPKSKVYNFAKGIYNYIKEIEKEKGYLGFSFGDVKIEQFPDGEFEPQIIPNSRLRNVIFIHDPSQDPSRWWAELLIINDAAKRASASNIINVLPYMRWSRSEKKNKPHIAITSRVAGSTISHVADRVITLDLHAEAIQGFFDIPVDALPSYLLAPSYIKKNYPEIIEDLVVVSPDTGAVQRTRKHANEYGEINIAIIDKKRKSGEEIEIYNVVGDVKGKNCLMVDDILSSGRTLADGAKALRKEGAKKVYAYATHFVGVGDYKKNIKELDQVFVTDTFYHDISGLDKIKIISAVPLFAEAIYRAEKGESVSELYK